MSNLSNIDFENLSREDLISILECEKEDILKIMSLANSKREHNYVTYSKNVFIPLTKICRNDCGYCAFKQNPDDPDAIILKDKEEVLEILKEAEKYGCKEALFTMGEDADTEEAVKVKLDKLGFKTMADYIYDICKSTAEETSLLPHTNAGNFSYEDMKMLKEYNISMGMMLESSSERLTRTIAHEKSPGKNPKLRLETIKNAGKLNIAYTTGILIGIGETKEEIADSLLAIKELCDKYGHIQEVIIQNFTVSPGIEMENYEEPSLLDMLRTVAAAQLLFDEGVSVQVPPNLNYETSQIFLLCGTDDWGGVSPLSEDYVNPSSPWPTLEKLEKLTNDAGYQLKERLAIYEKYINEKYIKNPELLEKTKQTQKKINK
ncbi:7,8-didemethyl-8-hydroxy-5-deazariboflavin synthase subunit CofG [Methanobrevibacter olleyae]|uniref:7,8-didemethyl-8-hydroxy-5-deazariboflavin synthase n=1 Tax=Methanobrevibacter olleyae TaxID=294671 RepID=A0A126R1X3_METOL|nr:7,8-didemethyl-8-hydroxy-5-deazariboflavin synthase subunit CofG [Methanobrevibacter olleyae]AMK15969.1 FO synthase subunit 1 CofG [Methanobrevibacter olleyae]